jgi:hypothetical protein
VTWIDIQTDDWAIDDETRGLERVAEAAGWRHALGLSADESLRAREVRLSESIRHRHRVIPVDQVDIPGWTVVELRSRFRNLLENVERRVAIKQRSVEPCRLSPLVCPLMNAINDSREQLAATTAASAQPSEGAAPRAGA